MYTVFDLITAPALITFIIQHAYMIYKGNRIHGRFYCTFLR